MAGRPEARGRRASRSRDSAVRRVRSGRFTHVVAEFGEVNVQMRVVGIWNDAEFMRGVFAEPVDVLGDVRGDLRQVFRLDSTFHPSAWSSRTIIAMSVAGAVLFLAALVAVSFAAVWARVVKSSASAFRSFASAVPSPVSGIEAMSLSGSVCQCGGAVGCFLRYHRVLGGDRGVGGLDSPGDLRRAIRLSGMHQVVLGVRPTMPWGQVPRQIGVDSLLRRRVIRSIIATQPGGRAATAAPVMSRNSPAIANGSQQRRQ